MRLGFAIVFGLVVFLAAPVQAQQPGLAAGTDILFLRPTFSSNPANSSNEFDWGPERAHAFWAGYTLESGWGIRFDAQLFDGDASKQQVDLNSPTGLSAAPTFAPFGISSPSAVLSAGLGEDQLWFRSHLRMLRTELAGTYGWWDDDWSVQLSAGIRYQLLRQEYNVDLNNTGDGITMESLALRTSREFVGLGPTVGIFGSYRFAQSWSVYGKFRGAVAFGVEDQQAIHSGTLTDPNFVLGSGNNRVWGSDRERVDRAIPITELELGIEYATDLGPLHTYIRGGFVAQSYFNAGGAAGGSASLNMIGGQVSVGVRY